MKQTVMVDANTFKEMFAVATDWLERSVSDIDALNVFPVPDGDTGTNMLLTMRSAIEEAYNTADSSVSAVASAMAAGALIGARGNSGVILSQIWRGFAEAVGKERSLGGKELARALVGASVAAYQGINNPVEGTILTVVKDAAQAAQAQAGNVEDDFISVLEAAVEMAQRSVANTPKLLDVLREAGVVDAGGQGFYTILDGALRYLKGEAELMKIRKPQIIAASIPLVPRAMMAPTSLIVDEKPFGYCTEFLVRGTGLSPEKVRSRLMKKGESLIVVGNREMVRVHIHTLSPGNIISYATSLGVIHSVSIRNMDEQFRDFLKMQQSRAPAVDTAIVAVVSGPGLASVFASLGAREIVPGGQTMNPSVKDLLQAVEKANAGKVLILPNNENIIASAQQVKKLTSKKVGIVPTRTIPQGVAAVLAFDYEADFDTNLEGMTEAAASVRSIEITRAIRSTRVDGLSIKKNQAIGLLDGKLVAAADGIAEVLNELLERMDLSRYEVITLYSGADTTEDEARKIQADLKSKYPDFQVEMVSGGQPHYSLIVSIE